MALVKILFSSNHRTLHDNLQTWLQDNPGQAVIHSISMDSNQYGHCLAIAYSNENGPVYRGNIWFHSRHSELETQVNEALSGKVQGQGALIALGSNDYGHALCLIEPM